jgi:hypothetical protein
MTIYTIETQSRETEQYGWRTLAPGMTEEQAIVEAELAAQESRGEAVYLRFSRTDEGQRGFINPGTGAALTGEDWVCR